MPAASRRACSAAGSSSLARSIAERRTERLRLGALGVEFLGGEEVLVRASSRQQALGVGAVAIGVRTLKERPFVPGDPEPGEAVENDLRVRVGAALLVGVLDAQDEHAAEAARVEPVEERGARAADVQVAGGGGGEADAWVESQDSQVRSKK